MALMFLWIDTWLTVEFNIIIRTTMEFNIIIRSVTGQQIRLTSHPGYEWFLATECITFW